jgi:DNA-binding beta-propeller fold protein YncE
VRAARIGGNPLGLALTADGTVALVADSLAQGNGKLLALAVPSLAVLGSIMVGVGPIEVAVTPDGRKAYVSNEYSRSMSVIDLPAPGRAWPTRAASLIPVDPYPVGLAVSPDGTQVYVTCEWGDLLEYSTADGTLTNWVNSGAQSVRVVLGEDGHVAWVTVRGENELRAYNAQTLAPLGQVEVGTQPVGVALIDGGTVAAVADSARFVRPAVASQVTFVSTAGVLAGRAAVLGTVPGGYFPREFALTPHGRQLLVTEFDSQKVAVFDVAALPKV